MNYRLITSATKPGTIESETSRWQYRRLGKCRRPNCTDITMGRRVCVTPNRDKWLCYVLSCTVRRDCRGVLTTRSYLLYAFGTSTDVVLTTRTIPGVRRMIACLNRQRVGNMCRYVRLPNVHGSFDSVSTWLHGAMEWIEFGLALNDREVIVFARL